MTSKNNNINKYIILFIILLIISLLLLLLLLKWNEGFYNKLNYNNVNDILINNIDAFIYINLENREDRKKEILAEFEKLSIPDNKIHKISGVYIPNNGHKGCVQSHILALNMAKLNGWQNVMIMEDDAELIISPENFKIQFKNMMEYLNSIENKPLYDVLLMATANANKNPVNNNNDIVRVYSSTTSSAYVINNNYIDKMIILFTYLNSMMDSKNWSSNNNEKFALDQNWQEMQKKDKWYGWNNNPIKQRNSVSTTNQWLNKSK